MLEKLTFEDMPVSSRKYPSIVFKPERPFSDVILEINGLCIEIEGVTMFKDLTLAVNKGDKIAFVGANNLAKNHFIPDFGRGASARQGQLLLGSYYQQWLFSERE